jgi:stage II sporulation protein D
MLAWVLAVVTAVFGLSSADTTAGGSDETVRVAVGRFMDVVVIDGVGGPLQVRRSDGSVVGGDRRTVKLTLGRTGLFVDGQPLDRDVVTVTGPLLKLAGHSYRAALEVRFVRYEGRQEMLVVHPLDLETYVTGIVASELPRGWPLAAYQAQAVAARTFAVSQKYRRLDLPYHMESSVLDQVYHGVEREHALAEEAARTTRGLVLTWQRHLAQTYFHAACGGTTESALEGWGTGIDYLPGSPCGRCMTAGTNRAKWSVKVHRSDADKAFSKLVGGPLTDVRIVSRTATGRAKQVELQSGRKKKTISGADFRRLLGWSVVWSTQIDRITLDGSTLVVDGRGSGHGVGMCQWGARGYGDDGVPFDEILGRYYPGASLKRLY